MAYYGSTAIEQGAAGIGQPPWAGAYADGVVGGRPGEPMPGPLQAFRDGIFSSLESGLDQDLETAERNRKIMYAVGAVALVGVVAFVMRKKRRR